MNALLALALLVTLAAPEREFTLKTRAQRRTFLAASGQLPAQEFAVSGGLGNGKSIGALLGSLAAGDAFPGVRIAYCGNEAAALKGAVVGDFRENVLPPELANWNERMRCGFKESESAGTFYFPHRNGKQSVIRFIGLDKPERLMSANYHRMVFEQAEQLRFDQFAKAKSRAARQAGYPNGGTIAIFNPDHPRHWANLRYRFGDGSRKTEIDGLSAEVVVCDPDDVFAFATPAYALEVRSWQGVYRDRWYLGKWVEAEGAAFPMWNPNVHIADAPSSWGKWGGYPPPDWPRYRGIDFGWRNPFACLTWARDPEGVHWLYRQRMRCERLAEDHARDIVADEALELQTLRERCEPGDAQSYRPFLAELNVIASFHDPADPEDAATLQRHGVWCVPGKNDQTAGRELVVHMLTRNTLRVVRGSLVDPCPILSQRNEPQSLEEEMPEQRYQKLPASANPVAERRELLVDEKNHAYKTLHYLFLSLETQQEVMIA